MVAVLRVAGRAGGSGQGGNCGLPRVRVGDFHVHDTVSSPGSKPDPEPRRQVRARNLRREGWGGRHHPGLRAADRGLRLGTPIPAAPDNDSENPEPVDGLAGQPTSAPGVRAAPSTSGRSSSAPRPDRGPRCRCRAHAAAPSLPARRRSPRGSYASAASPASPRGPPVTIPDANKDEQRQRSLCDVLDVGWSRTPARFEDVDMTLRKTAGRHNVSALPVASGISECLVPVMRPWDHE